MMIRVNSYIAGHWLAPDESARSIASAVTGEEIAVAGNTTIDFAAALRFAKTAGGPALHEMTFHERASRLKALATHLKEHRESLIELAFNTGATRADSKVDIDGGIGTVFVFASKGKRELPADTICTDGDLEPLSRGGSFVGQHIYTSKPGVAVHINAYNFPVWGMLEKLAPALLAGMPAIIKPATSTCYVTEACFRLMLDSEIFPPGCFQLIAGGTGHLLDLLESQDMVSFTGSAATALQLRSNTNLLKRSVPFIAEQDSLNASMLAPDITADSAAFSLFVDEVCNEITVKAGQKCTAIRRILVPGHLLERATDAISERLDKVNVGDPRNDDTQMGALISDRQRDDVKAICQQLASVATQVTAGAGTPASGAYMAPVLFQCNEPDQNEAVHALEAFGPVSTIMPYRDVAHGCELLNRGDGSLVASVITEDPKTAREITEKSAAFHGRLYFNNSQSMNEATGHGSPLPHLTHGGPGRAGGGEELGGIRSVKHYMQRSAIQGSPDIIRAITATHVPGATLIQGNVHPFRKKYGELQISESLSAGPRTITLDDIEHFANFTGDTFYAHMDEEAAKANPFFPGRVAHGYLLLSFAAGLFVDPDPGPVLANTGLEGLSFQKPVSTGDALSVTLIVKHKTPRNKDYGEVRWHVTLSNQNNEQVASYELHTMNAF